MKKDDRKNNHLLNELVKLRSRVAELEAAEHDRIDISKMLGNEGLSQTIPDLVGFEVICVDSKGKVLHSFGCGTDGEAFPNDELTGKKASDLLAPADARAIMADVRKVIKSGQPLYRKIGRYTSYRHGEPRLFRDDIIPAYDKDGNIIGAIIGAMDITKHREAQEALAESEARCRAVVEWSNDGIVLIDEERLVYANRKAHEMFGYSRLDDFVGKAFQSYIHQKDMEMIKKGYQKIRNGLADYPSFEFTGIRSDGVEIDIAASSTVVHVDGRLIIYLFLRDITEKKKNEEEKTKLIAELQSALSQVKALSGMLPICASCKKIRNDKGYWERIETYISQHSEAVFSHGICPDCIKKLYPDYYKKHSKKIKSK